jgi:hypothetical protein
MNIVATFHHKTLFLKKKFLKYLHYYGWKNLPNDITLIWVLIYFAIIRQIKPHNSISHTLMLYGFL